MIPPDRLSQFACMSGALLVMLIIVVMQDMGAL